ncbi:hypothetical protein QA646_28065 (plasmid) [Rhizobium sp. CB3090]|uniref:hypothetical protein n=1 Tax=Rhizobium sp. CB3090 TaxID=3039156 RepID=UPI0024B0DEE1|nr:hypothetical protein [Rhizobium sp. CB3090]WFU13185.1 hypothetical protein QA646_28065 [Rhizobium sp. CB3090]
MSDSDAKLRLYETPQRTTASVQRHLGSKLDYVEPNVEKFRRIPNVALPPFPSNSSPNDIGEVSNVPRSSIFVRDAQTDGPLHLAAGLHDPAFHAATNARNMGRRLLVRRNNVKNRANLAEGAGKSFVHVSSRGLRTAKRLKEAIKRVMEIQAQTLSNLSDARHSLR